MQDRGRRLARVRPGARQRGLESVARAFYAGPVPVSVSTLDGARILDVNDAFVRLFGYPREDLIGRSSVEAAYWVQPPPWPWTDWARGSPSATSNCSSASTHPPVRRGIVIAPLAPSSRFVPAGEGAVSGSWACPVVRARCDISQHLTPSSDTPGWRSGTFARTTRGARTSRGSRRPPSAPRGSRVSSSRSAGGR
jgi:hypothetical protein